jgi:modulator of FtsH protease
VAALAASVPVAISGLSMLAEWGGGLYWLFAAVALALMTAIGNAWVLLVEVVRDERYRPMAAAEGP